MYSLTVCSREAASTKTSISCRRDNNGVTSVYIQKGLCNRELRDVKLRCFGLPQQKLSCINTLHGRKLRSLLQT